MDDNRLTANPVQRPASGPDLTLAGLVGRTFVEALDTGLRRAGAGWRSGPRPVSEAPPAARAGAPVPEPDRGGEEDAVTLLHRYAAVILRRFETSLPLVVPPASVARRVSRLSLAAWGRGVLRSAMCLDPVTAEGAVRPIPGHQVVAAALLLECAAMVLPSGHPATAATIGALARAIRTLPDDRRTAATPAQGRTVRARQVNGAG
ncbi:hypothetical protein [Streptomyces phaeochromogenes]